MTNVDSFGAKLVEAEVVVIWLFPPEGVKWLCSVGKKKLHAEGRLSCVPNCETDQFADITNNMRYKCVRCSVATSTSQAVGDAQG